MFFKDVFGRWAGVAVVIALLAGAFPSTLPAARATQYEYIGSYGGTWHGQNNWSPTGVPSSDDDDALIPADKLVAIGDFNATVGSITVETDGMIMIINDKDLNLGTSRNGIESTVDGYVVFAGCLSEGGCTPRILLAEDDVVINGSEQIRGAATWRPLAGEGYDFDIYPGVIANDDEQHDFLLTIEEEVKVVGEIAIHVRLDNQAFVGVDDPRDITIDNKDTLQLTGETDKSATSAGQWSCTGGTLQVVGCTVTGAGQWILQHPTGEEGYDLSRIIIDDHEDTDVDGLSGDVLIEGGQFIVKSDFCTSGDIIYRSPADNVTPKIITESATAKFSLSCP